MLDVAEAAGLTVVAPVSGAGHVSTARAGIRVNDEIGTRPGTDPNLTLYEITGLGEVQRMPDICDGIEPAILVHYRTFEKQAIMFAGLDEQETDREIRELGLVPDMESLTTRHCPNPP